MVWYMKLSMSSSPVSVPAASAASASSFGITGDDAGDGDDGFVVRGGWRLAKATTLCPLRMQWRIVYSESFPPEIRAITFSPDGGCWGGILGSFWFFDVLEDGNRVVQSARGKVFDGRFFSCVSKGVTRNPSEGDFWAILSTRMYYRQEDIVEDKDIICR
ncbi:hypothetical protein BJX61DRAFT_513000 [Aspergillus egyptiacus]|nr:hypothetical protein BJX61DRAFT_513000 [Aspergillus egyptiacus]